jgi:hypothetical protein
MQRYKRLLQASLIIALGWLALTDALAQSVTTRVVAAGGSATSAKMVPGSNVAIDIRLDVVTAQLIGTDFKLSQTTPASNGFFSITGRSFTGSPFGDATSGTSDAIVLASPSNILNAANDDNLGRQTVGLVGTPAATNMLAASLTLTANASTPLGIYTFAPTPGVSFATDDALNDYDMSTGTPFTVVVGQTLTVIKTGTGSGTVVADSGAINCGATCSDIYPGNVVTLTAWPAAGSTFVGWRGGVCVGTGLTCTVAVGVPATITAQFDTPTFPLSVTKAGGCSGTVTSIPEGINCGIDCFHVFAVNTVVTLTAVPAASCSFIGWSGDGCSGTGTCVVTLVGATTVTATFTDATPPDTTILTGPSSPTNQGNVTFTFTSSEPGSTFRCSLNGGTPLTCSSPYNLFAGNGNNTLEVTAIDAAGNPDPTPASWQWTTAGVVLAPEPIPTLSEWGLIVLSMMMASLGLVAHRRCQ